MKHLSRLITAHNCFCSFLYNLALLVLIPVFLIPVAAIIMPFDVYLGLIIIMTILSSYTVFLDYLTFNGITAKGFSLGMIKNSPYAESFLKDAILADQIRRFIQIIIPPTISMIIAAITSSKGTDIRLIVFALTLIFLNYGTTTGILVLMRYILIGRVYAYISMALSIIFVLSNAGMMLLFLHNSVHIPFMIWLPITLILSVLISILAFRHTTSHCAVNLKEI